MARAVGPIITPPEVTERLVEEAARAGVQHVWMQPGAESAAAFSSRAWGLVHYLLVADPERRQKTRAWVDRLAEDEALRDAFLETYGIGAAALEREFAAYLESDPLPELRVELEKTASGSSSSSGSATLQRPSGPIPISTGT